MRNDYVVQKVLPTLAETEALLAVERATLGDSPYDPARVLELLRRPEHYAYLATLEGAPVGFCSCLETPTRDGPQQLELDMLGVLAAHRGRGVATRLIEQAMEDAQQRGVRRFRAVVREDNVASWRAFERAGLSAAGSCEMLVYEIGGRAPLAFLPVGWAWSFTPLAPGLEAHALRDAVGAPIAMAECVQVHTLAYAGLWLERLWAGSERAQALIGRAAVERAKSLALDEVGYLLPQTQARHSEADALLREGYRRAGRYIILTAGRA